MKTISVFLGLCVLAMTQSVNADDIANNHAAIIIKRGFYSGNDYRNAPETIRQVYVSGLVDGFFFSVHFGAPKTRVQPFETCVSSMTSPQLMAIADQYITKHPAYWDLDMNINFMNSMVEACRERGIDMSIKNK